MQIKATPSLAIIAVAASFFLAFGCARDTSSGSHETTQAVIITKPGKKRFSRSFETTSVAIAERSAYINPKVAATIKSFRVKEGDYVREGDVLAVLDGSDYEIAVNAAKAQLSAANAGVLQAEAAFAKVRADYERFKNLMQEGSVSTSDFEKMETGYKQAEAALAVAQAQREMAQSSLEGSLKQLRYTAITAPFSGYIAARNGEVGEMASPAIPRAMFEIIQSDRLKIAVFVSELEMRSITKDTMAQVTFDAVPNKQVPARVTSINSKVDPTTKSVKVELSLDNSNHLFKPGMTVRVRFTLPEQEYLVIPRNAVFTRDNEAGIVYVKNADDRVFTKEIFLGGLVDGYVIIERGLDGTEDIVVGGGRRLENGQRVTVVSSFNDQQ